MNQNSPSPDRAPRASGATRRDVIAAGLAGASALLLPRVLVADEDPSSGSGPARPTGRRTVVMLHLRGGNDGLNTVVPHQDPRYRAYRPTLALRSDAILTLDDEVGLHPSLGGLAELWEDGQVAVVEGVGYPDPDLSHFRSTDIWYAGMPSGVPRTGWIGRALAGRGASSSLVTVAIDREAPLSLHAEGAPTATFRDFDAFRLSPDLGRLGLLYRAYASAAGARGEVGRAGADALETARRIARLKPAPGAWRGRLGDDLARALALVEADLDLDAIHLAFDGFDTHAAQAKAHADLLAELGDNLRTWQTALGERSLDGKVVTLVYSEFGRRPKENVSAGTDHGTCLPVFLIGRGVAAGLHGRRPSLADLDDDNLRHTVDFRRVYAALLKDALHLDPRPVLGPHAPLELFS